MTTITEIEGVGPALEEKLKAAGVATVEALLDRGAFPDGRQTLAEETGIDSKRISRFVNHADLMRIKGVGGEFSELLEASGVDTVPELAQRNAANLTSKLREINESKKLVRMVPSEKTVAQWVEQAGEMPRVVMY